MVGGMGNDEGKGLRTLVGADTAWKTEEQNGPARHRQERVVHVAGIDQLPQDEYRGGDVTALMDHALRPMVTGG